MKRAISHHDLFLFDLFENNVDVETLKGATWRGFYENADKLSWGFQNWVIFRGMFKTTPESQGNLRLATAPPLTHP